MPKPMKAAQVINRVPTYKLKLKATGNGPRLLLEWFAEHCRDRHLIIEYIQDAHLENYFIVWFEDMERDAAYSNLHALAEYINANA